jgi:hypothetical protein
MRFLPHLTYGTAAGAVHGATILPETGYMMAAGIESAERRLSINQQSVT